MIVRIRHLFARIASLSLGLRIVILLVCILHVIGISWGLPSSDAWDNDGVAPRDFLPGIAQTYTPSEYFTYPPFHLALLALLTAPWTILASVRAGSTRVPAVLAEILKPSYMTAFSYTARIVTVLMSLGIVVALALIAEEISPPDRRRRVGVATAIVVAMGGPFTYYSHTSNLDVPMLFWASLSALALVRGIARKEPRRIRSALLFATFSIATKDQGYAMFFAGIPLALCTWLVLDEWARRSLGRIAKDVLIGGAIALVLLLFIDGAITNPSGFKARLGFLSGSASQDFATYTKDWSGRASILRDTARELGRHYPPWRLWPYAVIFAAGPFATIAAARKQARAVFAASFVPLLFALSFTVFFNMVARRVEERFMLPQVLFLGVYAGYALERCFFPPGRGAWVVVRWLSRAVCVIMVYRAFFDVVELDTNLLHDPRYGAEAYLAKHAQPGDTVEVHGLNVYLQRFSDLPAGVRVARVGNTPANTRGPVPGVEEVQAPLMGVEQRRPRFIVVSECFVWRYLKRDLGPQQGRIIPPTQNRDAADADATQFFQSLFDGKLAYHHAHESRYESDIFLRAFMHASVGCTVWTFERNGP